MKKLRPKWMILSLTCHIWNSQCMSITNVYNVLHTYVWSIPNVCTLLKFQQININIFIELNKGRRINYLTLDKFLKWSSSISFLWVITKEETINLTDSLPYLHKRKHPIHYSFLGNIKNSINQNDKIHESNIKK